jgi:PAS domain-containing protein
MPQSKPFSETIAKLILPFILLVVLICIAIFIIFLPMVRNNVIKKKKETISVVTLIAWHTLCFYQNLEKAGKISAEEAKRLALEQLRSVRYGKQDQDYFWIINIRGITLMHPYLIKNEGINHANLTDAEGKYFIKDFINTATKTSKTCGFVEYKWQKNNDPTKIYNKISHVRLFSPWGWIVGTGFYLDNINLDMAYVTRSILLALFIITGVVTILYFYVLKALISSENKKQTSFEKLLMQESKMKALLEAIPDMILRVDREGIVLDFKDPIGFKPFIEPSEILDKKIIDTWPKEIAEKLIASMERVFVTNEHQVLVFEIQDNVSDKMHIEAHFVLSGGNEILATFRDITKRKI